MSVNAGTIEPIAKVVKLSKNDWKSLATLLIVSLTFLCGVTWAIARQVVDTKLAVIEQTADRVAKLEVANGVTNQRLATQDKNQDQIMSQLKDISHDVKEVGQSVARIEGRTSASK